MAKYRIKSDVEILLRRLNDLNMENMRGGLQRSDYLRRRSSIEAQLREIGSVTPALPIDPDLRDGGILLPASVSAEIYSRFATVDKTERTDGIFSWPTFTYDFTITGDNVWGEALKKLSENMERELLQGTGGGTPVGIINTGSGNKLSAEALEEAYSQLAPRINNGFFGSAAEKVWKDHNGVILCECDNSDCDRVIPVEHDDYIKACGSGGYYRLTLADCPHGCLGYYLYERGKHWAVWAK